MLKFEKCVCSQCHKVQYELVENFAHNSVTRVLLYGMHTHTCIITCMYILYIQTSELVSCIIHSFLFPLSLLYYLLLVCVYEYCSLLAPNLCCPIGSWLSSVSSLYVFYSAILSFLMCVCVYVHMYFKMREFVILYVCVCISKINSVSSKNFQCQLIAKYPKIMSWTFCTTRNTSTAKRHWENWRDML